MNSKKHSENSAAMFGGRPADYVEIHELIDWNKTNSFSVYGRFFLHHFDVGSAILEKIFKNLHSFAPVKHVLLQHLIEDYNHVPAFSKWLDSFIDTPLLPKPIEINEQLEKIREDNLLRELSFKDIAQIQNILDLNEFTGNKEILNHEARYCIFGHALGAHLATRIIGEKIKDLWTLDVMVRFLDAKFSFVPSILDYEKLVPKSEWMLAPKNYDRTNIEETKKKIYDYLKISDGDSKKKIPESVPDKKEEKRLEREFQRYIPNDHSRCSGEGVLD